MRYILEPDNRNCPDDALFGDLRLVAAKLGKSSITKDDYNAHGRFSAATMQSRFGSWNSALEKSGLHVQKRINIPRDELLSDLKRVATKLGTETLSTTDYERVGQFSVATVQRAFGSWPNALKAADLKPSENWRPRTSQEELLSNLALVWETLGRQPKKSDFHPPISHISAHAYTRRFGSWRQALESFVALAGQAGPEELPPQDAVQPPAPQPSNKRTARDPSWRLRFLVNRRDRFTCRACGRSPATHPGVVLHVDHIVPWSQGGETTFDNLQTLCEVCNIGKSDLSMHGQEG